MAWTFDEKSPIYLQIAYRVKLKIASKELTMGQQLLPVREFAQEAGVNPNINQKRHEIAQNLIKNFVTEMSAIGFSSPEIKTIITDYIEQRGKEL